MIKITTEQELRMIKAIHIEPIYTSGGHGYEDDDDEDFWCPICHQHLGTHHGYDKTCSLCGQNIAEFDGLSCYSYKELATSEINKQWKELNT